MLKHEHSITIDRPIDKVFGFLTNPDNLLRFEQSAGPVIRMDEGPVRPGFKFEARWEFEVESLDTVCEYTEIEANKTIASRLYNKAFDFDSRYRFEVVDASTTKVTSSYQGGMLGPWKEMEPMFAEEFKREDEAELMAMKKEIEAST